MLIKELSLKTGASIRSLRYYEEKELLLPKRLENGYREYDDIAVERVKTIQLYLSLGLNTEDIVQIIECPTTVQKRPLCKTAYELYKTKLNAINKQIDILHSIQLKLQERINEFNSPDQMVNINDRVNIKDGE